MNWLQRKVIEHYAKKFIRRLDIMPSLKGWRTVAVNVVMILTAMFAMPEITTIVPAQYVVVIVSGLNIGLRLITSTPVGVK